MQSHDQSLLCDIVYFFYSWSWKNMDRQQSRETLSRVFYSVRGHDQITLTSSINSSRRWWSRTIWPYYVVLRDGHLTTGYLFVQREEDQRKGFNLVLNPNSSKHFLYFRAIQGLSGGNLVDFALQDNVLLPEDPTEYINHIGKSIRSGLIPGGRSVKRKRQTVFHNSEPDGRRSKYGKTNATWTSRGSLHTKYLETSSKHSVLVHFQASS